MKSTPRSLARALLAAACVATALAPAPSGEAEVLNRIVLQVNDRIATLMDYELRRSQMLGDVAASGMTAEEKARARDQVGERVFRDLFEEMLLLSRADQLEITIPEEYLTSVIDNMRQEMGVSTDQEFELALAQTGLSPADFRERWRTNLRMREVISREVNAVIAQSLTEESLRRIYTQNPDRFRTPRMARVREVVVLEDSGLSPAEQRELAGRVARDLRLEADVQATIDSLSEAGETSTLIDHGWVEPGELSPALDDLVFTLDAGEVGEPVTARGGLHVVQVMELREPSVEPFNDVMGRVRKSESDRLFEERYAGFLEDLETHSYIRLEPPPGAAGFRRANSSLAGDVVPGDEENREALLEREAAGAADPEDAAGDGTVDDQEEILPLGVVSDSSTDPAPPSGPPVQPELVPPVTPEPEAEQPPVVDESETEPAPVPPDPPPF